MHPNHTYRYWLQESAIAIRGQSVCPNLKRSSRIHNHDIMHIRCVDHGLTHDVSLLICDWFLLIFTIFATTSGWGLFVLAWRMWRRLTSLAQLHDVRAVFTRLARTLDASHSSREFVRSSHWRVFQLHFRTASAPRTHKVLTAVLWLVVFRQQWDSSAKRWRNHDVIGTSFDCRLNFSSGRGTRGNLMVSGLRITFWWIFCTNSN